MLDKLKIHNFKLHTRLYEGLDQKFHEELFPEIEWALYDQVGLQLRVEIDRQLHNQLFRQITIQINAK